MGSAALRKVPTDPALRIDIDDLAAVAPALRPLVAGIERADRVVKLPDAVLAAPVSLNIK